MCFRAGDKAGKRQGWRLENAMNMLALVYVGAGGAIGAMLRYLCVEQLMRLPNPSDFPIGTLMVNLLGGFLLGAWLAWLAYSMPGKFREMHWLLAVGVLGGFTTFSAFSLDLFLLLERGAYGLGALYALGSVLGALAALMGGMWAVKLVAG
jgi:CrcB protein